MYGPNEAIFSIPISKAYSNQIDKIDAVKLAIGFDEPFNGPFKKIDVRFKGRFKSNESSVTFEIELKWLFATEYEFFSSIKANKNQFA